jgi:hypothetical protein
VGKLKTQPAPLILACVCRRNSRVPENAIRPSFCEKILSTGGLPMNQYPSSFSAVVRQPSAWLPLAMSLTALALVLGHIALYGAVREADEGTAAHLWQILMGGQLPVLAFFAVRWLPRAPRPALGVLALQAVAVLASMAPVFFFNL